MIKFGNPVFFTVFICAVIFVLFLIWASQQRKAHLQLFAEKNLIDDLLSALDKRKRKVKLSLQVCAVFLCLFSFLRPQWGFYWEEVRKEGTDILIAVDTSKSMLAEDIKPNRLLRTKMAVKDLLKYLGGDRIGLIAFAGTAFTVCPLTIDYYGFVLSLNELDTSIIPMGGTSLSAAINEALQRIKYSEGQCETLILITDGEDNVGGVWDAAREAAKAGLKIFCIGIGTREGEIIPITDEKNNRTFLKDRQGNVVKTRLDENTLKKIARITNGAYVKAEPADFGLQRLYREKISKIGKRGFKDYRRKEFYERFQIFLSIAVIFLFIESLIEEKRAV